MEDMATGEIRLEHPVGMAAQGRGADGGRSETGVKRRRSVHARRCSRGCSTRSTTKLLARRQPRRARRRRRRRRCRSRARSSRPTCTNHGKLPWCIDLLNLTLGAPDLDEALRRIDRLARLFSEARHQVDHAAGASELILERDHGSAKALAERPRKREGFQPNGSGARRL